MLQCDAAGSIAGIRPARAAYPSMCDHYARLNPDPIAYLWACVSLQRYKRLPAIFLHNYGNMVRCMRKTTVELPDDLLIEAKKRAAELRRPLRHLVEAGLRAQLARTTARSKTAALKIRWITVKGGLPPDLDLQDRGKMHDRLRQNR